MSLVKVILGSTRPERFGIQPAEWIMELSQQHSDTKFELVDLQEVDLPFLDEPKPALHGDYKKDHTKRWSKAIDEADGFIVIAGEYNHTITPALVNAIDFLAAEWRHKPIAFVSYGAAAGGARAVEHLRAMAGQLGMYDLTDDLPIVNYWTQMDENGKFQPTPAQTATAHKLIDSVSFWAESMKNIRAKIKQ